MDLRIDIDYYSLKKKMIVLFIKKKKKMTYISDFFSCFIEKLLVAVIIRKRIFLLRLHYSRQLLLGMLL